MLNLLLLCASAVTNELSWSNPDKRQVVNESFVSMIQITWLNDQKKKTKLTTVFIKPLGNAKTLEKSSPDNVLHQEWVGKLFESYGHNGL